MKSGWIILLLVSFNLLAQPETKSISLAFHPVFGNSSIHLNDSIYVSEKDTFRFEVLKFYVSAIQLLQDHSPVWSETKSFHLIDVADGKSMNLSMQIPQEIQFDQIEFKFGIDSTTNVSGAMGGDLDPTRGMYWTWQSGYINCKLEGKTSSRPAPKHEFQFHLGGYQFPDNTCQLVQLQVKNKEQITILLDLEKLVSNIDFQKDNHIMSPNQQAKILSEKMARLFKIQVL